MCPQDFDRERGYFEWLCDLIHVDREKVSYRILMSKLYKREFYSIVPHDENRALDGLSLRDEYYEECGGYFYPSDAYDRCSVLEMIIAIARRMSFETVTAFEDRTIDLTEDWFWELIDNLGLTDYSDDNYSDAGGNWDVDGIIDRFLSRKYKHNGRGGLFPLQKSKQDQRKIELWYQMGAYLAEKEAV